MPDASPSSSQEAKGRGSARPFSSVLCAVDGTRRSFAAVEQSAALVGSEGHLTLLAVTAERGSGAYRSAAISPKRAERIIARANRIAERAEVPCTSLVDPAGPPPEVILERASEHDLLALGAPRSSWFGALLFDGVAEAALSSFTTPTLAARVCSEGQESFAQRILVASDGLDGSDELVQLTAQLARSAAARVTLLHVSGVESRSRPHRIESQGETLRSQLGARSEVRIEVGAPDDAILHIASETASSLVVMCSRRIGTLKGLGSVSRRVVHKAHCSVLLLPPESLQR